MTGEPRADGMRPEAEAIEALRALVEGARRQAPNLKALLEAALTGGPDDTPETLARSGPVAVSGQDFLFLLKTKRPAAVAIDEQPPVPMTPIEGTGYAYRLETLRLGTTHNFLWHVGGHVLGGMGGTMPRSVAGYNPDSYPIQGAPRGTLSETRTITSQIYGGATSRYWVYTNPGIDTERGAPVMVWLDGQNHVGLMDVFGTRMQTVTDNLVHRKLIPPMVHILIEPSTGGSLAPTKTPPGTTPESELRSIQYDTVNDDFGRHLVEEVLPGGREDGQAAARRLLTRHHRPFVRRDRLVQRLLEPPGRVQPGALGERELHGAPVAPGSATWTAASSSRSWSAASRGRTSGSGSLTACTTSTSART